MMILVMLHSLLIAVITFSNNVISLLNINLINISIDDDLGYDDFDTITFDKVIDWCKRYK